MVRFGQVIVLLCRGIDVNQLEAGACRAMSEKDLKNLQEEHFFELEEVDRPVLYLECDASGVEAVRLGTAQLGKYPQHAGPA